MRHCLLAVAALGCASRLTAADPAVERMTKDLYYLAGPECEGRGTQTEGINRAADYIADQFRAAGLRPAGAEGSYSQPFRIAGPPKLGTPNALALTGPDGKTTDLRYGTDFTPTALSAAGKVNAGVAFVGYGITADQPKYDDYDGLDVKGKFVLVLRQGPRAGAKEPPFDSRAGNPHTALADKLGNAVRHGAAGVLFVNPRADAKDDALMEFGYAAGNDEKVPVFQVKRAVLDRMLAAGGSSLTAVEDAIDEKLEPQSRLLPGWTAAAEATITRPGIAARNVVGVADGSGPLADETVVVGAHYDHLGFGEKGSLAGKDAKGKVHFGADDNASGTTALIELARRFGGMKGRVGRRVVFVAFSGEEIDLLGSKHYCKNPPFPLETTAFMLNMDMVGRSGVIDKGGMAAAAGVPAVAGPGGWGVTQRLVFSGTGTADGLDRFVADATKDAGFKLLTTAGGTGPSDHDSFYRKKIPVLFAYTGSHRDYHKPTDTPDKIDYVGMERIVDLMAAMTDRLAAAPDRLKYQVVRETWDDPTEPAPKRSARGGPRLGIMPGNYESADGGVLVDDLSPGGAAEKGGIKAGDVVVEIAGKPVRNIGGYMSAMAGQKADQEIEVVVVRNDKRVTLKVTPRQ